ncbi:hypothetical protein IQ230_10380 [Gloeocapsopsis crepidinum LEGE 06123]|uniref:Uncharacterized protein n=1 Tax=Gloeocapsopsis crepidinum LEGE 06123 TaxID=588587 RepID=A0ABR9URQ7_9CHRO|nr:hypothetical protein [Gloeocapsopsis crepidinum]MBE9190753.1 hypothetical protein [Gloeocapsopsis crepidinum LEGE 06123]
MRQQILEQSKCFDDEMRQKSEQNINLVEKGIQDVRTKKIDRTTLANLLTLQCSLTMTLT